LTGTDRSNVISEFCICLQDLRIHLRGGISSKLAERSDGCSETRKVNEWIETFYFSVFCEPNNQCFVKIEKILVDLFMGTKKVNLMDIGEYQKIFSNIICNYRINMAEMLDYWTKND
jgi:hypothetical protein